MVCINFQYTDKELYKYTVTENKCLRLLQSDKGSQFVNCNSLVHFC